MRARRLFRMGRQKWEQKNGKFQPVLLEKHVVKELVVRLWANGVKVWVIKERIPGKGMLSTPGIPDLMGYMKDPHGTGFTHPVFIEVKRPGGVRRDAQIRFIDEAKRDGCVAGFADSWDSCKALFEKCGIHLS